MQLNQTVQLLLAPMSTDGFDFIGDDNAMVVKLKDTSRQGPFKTCSLRVNLDVMGAQQENVWLGKEPKDVLNGCPTAIVILTSMPERDIMQLLHTIFHQVFPGSKISD